MGGEGDPEGQKKKGKAMGVEDATWAESSAVGAERPGPQAGEETGQREGFGQLGATGRQIPASLEFRCQSAASVPTDMYSVRVR